MEDSKNSNSPFREMTGKYVVHAITPINFIPENHKVTKFKHIPTGKFIIPNKNTIDSYNWEENQPFSGGYPERSLLFNTNMEVIDFEIR